MRTLTNLVCVVCLGITVALAGAPPNDESIQAAADKVSRQIASLSADVDVRNKIDHEYYLMSHELIALKDPKVLTVMEPHIKKINRLINPK